MTTSDDDCPTADCRSENDCFVVPPQSSSLAEDIRTRYVIEAFAHEAKIRASLYRFTGNFADIEELLQDTYVRILTMKTTGQRRLVAILPFALTVARNVACDWLRHQKVVSLTLVADLDSEVSDENDRIDERLSFEQELEALADIVDSMPPRRRQVFRMRKVYGLSQKEIARALALSENTVEQHLTSAVRNIARLFTPHSPPAAFLLRRKRRRADSTPSVIDTQDYGATRPL